MKTHLSLAILLALIISLLAGPALAWDEAKLKAEVQALLDQAAAGMVKKDVQAVVATAVPQATIKYVSGRTLTMAQWQEESVKDFADMQDLTSKFVVEKVWPRGKDQAGVIFLETDEFTRSSDPGHKHRISARFRAHLAMTPQGWRLAALVGLREQFTRDGQVYNPYAKPKKPAQAGTPQGHKAD